MFAIANERKSLWQWDLNQKLTVAGDCTEVHYLDRGAPSTLTVSVKDGKADIPNILLQKAGRLVVYAYIIDEQDHHTKVCETFGIAPRLKPAEYVYTETEVKTWSDLQSQIGDLANLATEEKNNLVAAINEAAQSGGGGAGAWYVTLTPDDDGNITADKTMAEIEAAYQAGYAVYCIFLFNAILAIIPIIAPLTVHLQNEQYVFCGVGSIDKLYSFQFEVTESGWKVLQKELAQKSDIPAAYNLPKATANALGGVKADPATADDTQPVRIDDSGKLVTAAGSGDISLGLTSATVGQTIKVKTVDTDGRPTSWEAADVPSNAKKWIHLSKVKLTEETGRVEISVPYGNIREIFGVVEVNFADGSGASGGVTINKMYASDFRMAFFDYQAAWQWKGTFHVFPIFDENGDFYAYQGETIYTKGKPPWSFRPYALHDYVTQSKEKNKLYPALYADPISSIALDTFIPMQPDSTIDFYVR